MTCGGNVYIIQFPAFEVSQLLSNRSCYGNGGDRRKLHEEMDGGYG